MTTDRELLEAAARAYWGDSDVTFRFDEQENAIVYIDANNQDHNGRDIELLWLPLLDDGDALRLAVKLRISVYHAPSGFSLAVSADGSVSFKEEAIGEQNTRRAIVRAAAAMTAGKPELQAPKTSAP